MWQLAQVEVDYVTSMILQIVTSERTSDLNICPGQVRCSLVTACTLLWL